MVFGNWLFRSRSKHCKLLSSSGNATSKECSMPLTAAVYSWQGEYNKYGMGAIASASTRHQHLLSWRSKAHHLISARRDGTTVAQRCWVPAGNGETSSLCWAWSTWRYGYGRQYCNNQQDIRRRRDLCTWVSRPRLGHSSPSQGCHITHAFQRQTNKSESIEWPRYWFSKYTNS